MKKQIVRCPEQYYDFYTIPFPFKALKKERRKKYIYSELGKLHPCFSDDCCFDSHLQIDKSGLKARVVVMQKYKLAEFKSLKAQKMVFVKECGRTPFFKSVEKRKPVIIFGIVFLVLCGVYVLFKFVVWDGLSSQIFLKAQNTENKTDLVSTTFITEQSESYVCIVPSLLNTLCKNQADIKSFEWKTDGFTEKISLSVRGIFPEVLNDFSEKCTFSPVTFDKGKPLMTVTAVQKNRGNLNFVKTETTSNRAELRRLLNEEGANLVEETITPYGVSFSIPGEIPEAPDFSKNSFIHIFNYFNSLALPIDSVCISASNENLNISCVFSEVNLPGTEALCSSLCENADLFFDETNVAVPVMPKVKTEPENKVKKERVGKVIMNDGTVVEFYKNENGKITKEIK